MNISTRLTALLLALLMFLSVFATAETAYDPGSMTPEQWQSLVDNAQKELFTVDEGGVPVPTTPPAEPEKTEFHPYTDAVTASLTAGEDIVSLSMSTSGVAVLTCSAEGQWQMELEDMWVGITGAEGAELWVSAAMMNGLTTANFRKALSDGTYTQTAALTLTEAQPALLFAQPRAEEADAGQLGVTPRSSDPYDLSAANAGLTKYIVQVNYLFENSTQAASPYIAQIGENDPSLTAAVTFPVIEGYAPDTSADLPEGFTYTTDGKGINIALTGIAGDISVDVVYKPAQVDFVVEHYLQNITDDNYPAAPEFTDTISTGKTGDTIKSTYPDPTAEQYYATYKTYDGFLPLIYNENATIAANGSTVVPVYYVRLYYLMALNLQGGRGVEPLYAKHGTSISVGEPTRLGYTFKGWSTDKDGTDMVGKTLPSVMPIGNSTYYAQWEPAASSYRVVYWLEDADPSYDEDGTAYSTYSTFGSFTVSNNVKTEDEVDGETYKTYDNYITTDSNFEAVEAHIEYDEDKTEKNVVVEGDGSTTVNVYYKRNEYTLRFYYAMSELQRNKTIYYVIGGNTYYFGKDSSNRIDRNDDIALLEQYFTSGNAAYSHKGKVTALPTVKDEVKDRYIIGQETNDSKTHTYYYLELTARYGADLSLLWPFAIFNSVTIDETHSQWIGKEAFFSGWNGEYNVKYTQDNKNETIKGNYGQLDDNLLWTNDTPDDNTISFLAFWENGANISWSIPKLFQYHIWVKAMDGEDLSGYEKTKYHNGSWYYLDQDYATIDNTDQNTANGLTGQTPPAISGLTYTGSSFREDLVAQSKYDKNPSNYPNIAGTYDDTVYAAGYNAHFFYTRNTYKLTLINSDGKEYKTVNLLYGDSLAAYAAAPSEPTTMDAGSATFDGWYTAADPENGEKFDFTDATMPAGNLILYANWEPKTYTVTAYATKELADAAAEGTEHFIFTGVKHGETTSTVFHYGNEDYFDPETGEYKKPVNGEWEFTHWYYIDANGEEKIFDFTGTPITADTTVYAGWMANKIVSYTVYYVLEGTDYADPDNWVADSVTGSGLAGHTITGEAAKGGTELYAAFSTGYFPTVQSATFALDLDETKNVYVFEYRQAQEVPYTVHHLTTENPGNGLGYVTIGGTTYYRLAASVTDMDNRKAVVTENYVVAGSYIPDAFQKRLVLTAEGTDADMDGVLDENVIIFYYHKDPERVPLQVNHYTIPYGGQPALHDTSNTIVTPLPKDVTVDQLAIANYTYDPSRTTRSDGGGTPYATTALSFNLASGAQSVVMNLYYVENDVTLHYAVAPASTGMGTVSRTEETFGILSSTPAGSTASAAGDHQFVGWYADSACTELLSTDAAFVPDNWADGDTFYALFEPKTADLVIRKVVEDAAFAAAPADDVFTIMVTFTGTYAADSYPYTMTSADGTSVTGTLSREDGSFTITGVKDGDEITIKDVAVNTAFTVEESNHASYSEFVSPDSSIIGEDGNTVVVTNTYRTGTLSISKTASGTSDGESFVFQVTGPGFNGLVSLKNGETKTLTNLTLGTYTVTETDWSYRYTPDTKSQSVTLSETNLTDALSFTNTRSNDKWLNDEDSVHNDFSRDGNYQ